MPVCRYLVDYYHTQIHAIMRYFINEKVIYYFTQNKIGKSVLGRIFYGLKNFASQQCRPIRKNFKIVLFLNCSSKILMQFDCLDEVELYFGVECPEFDHKHNISTRQFLSSVLNKFSLDTYYLQSYTISSYQLKYTLLHDRADPHHLVSTSGGQSCPPRLACLKTSLRRVISPIPHDLLQALHDDHSVTLQSRGGPENQTRKNNRLPSPHPPPKLTNLFCRLSGLFVLLTVLFFRMCTIRIHYAIHDRFFIASWYNRRNGRRRHRWKILSMISANAYFFLTNKKY